MDFALLFSLLFCHWAGDFTHLHQPFMLDAKRLGKPLMPILAHAAVHAGLMGLVLLFFYGLDAALTGFAIQLSTHFFIDLWKGKMNEWFPVLQDATNKWHWWVFGLDQQLHIAVIVWMTWLAPQG